MRIKEIMTSDIVTIGTHQSIKDAALIMMNHDIGFIPVINQDLPVGVVTDRDLVVKGYAQGLSERTPIKDVMTSHCITADIDSSVDDVAEIMAANKIRRICIVEKGRLVGVCAIGDLAIYKKSEDDAGYALSKISKPAPGQHLGI